MNEITQPKYPTFKEVVDVVVLKSYLKVTFTRFDVTDPDSIKIVECYGQKSYRDISNFLEHYQSYWKFYIESFNPFTNTYVLVRYIW